MNYIKPVKKVKVIKNEVYNSIPFVLENKVFDVEFLLEEIFDIFRPPFYQILKFLSDFTEEKMYKEKL